MESLRSSCAASLAGSGLSSEERLNDMVVGVDALSVALGGGGGNEVGEIVEVGGGGGSHVNGVLETVGKAGEGRS